MPILNNRMENYQGSGCMFRGKINKTPVANSLLLSNYDSTISSGGYILSMDALGSTTESTEFSIGKFGFIDFCRWSN